MAAIAESIQCSDGATLSMPLLHHVWTEVPATITMTLTAG